MSHRFVVGIETECLTVARRPQDLAATMAAFFEELAQAAPSLSCAGGLFNGYGRVYCDGAHLELATAECDDPFVLVSLQERLERLLTTAAERLGDRFLSLLLANCNHAGPLRAGCPTWGLHENYLVPVHPAGWAERVLPFLATRVFCGAGAVHAPTGDFLAGARLLFLEFDQGGGTTSRRALHSTARDEALTSDPRRYGYRYHLVLGDGLRSQFGRLLQCGATLLAVHATTSGTLSLRSLPSSVRFWVRASQTLNRLAACGSPPKLDPLAIRVQRLYLEAARRFRDSLSEPPGWIDRVLDAWETTLTALERDDRDWLARRLDPWIKYELFTTFLRTGGHTWEDVPRSSSLQNSLALLNQQYHEFTNPDSPFAQLDRAGLLAQRLTPLIEPGTEREPFVPDVHTRAAPRARLIREYRGKQTLSAGWEGIYNAAGRPIVRFDDPCSIEPTPCVDLTLLVDAVSNRQNESNHVVNAPVSRL